MSGKSGTVSLDELLDCLPLVYNPTTRSIQLGGINHCSTKTTISNGSAYNCSIAPSESPEILTNIPGKLKNVRAISQNEEEKYDNGCETLPGEENKFSSHDCSTNKDNGPNVDLCSYKPANRELCSALSELNTENSLQKTKGGLSFLSDFLSKKNTENASMSEAMTNSSQKSNSCYSWKFFSRVNSKNTKCEDVQAGSVGLIMEKRPSNLPAKNSEEEKSHKKQHHEIVSSFKKKEKKEAKERKKLQSIQLKHELEVTEAVSIWKNDIIPHWESMKNTKRAIALWWHGIPSCVRGHVWKLTIGNDLNMSSSLFKILMKRSEEKLSILNNDKNCDLDSACAKNFPSLGDHEATIEFIKLDVSRTFPHLGVFQKGGPMYDVVHNLLCAYVCYRPDVGYVQGMSFLAAMLLLNLPEDEAFVAFSNMVCRSPHIQFFSIDQMSMSAYYNTFSDMLTESMPTLSVHFRGLNVTPDMYLMDWILSLFSRSLPLDVASRLWDIYLRDGEVFIFQAALGILKLYEATLLLQECNVMCAQFLTRLREDLDANELFRAIAVIQATVSEDWFEQRLQTNMSFCRQSNYSTQTNGF